MRVRLWGTQLQGTRINSHNSSTSLRPAELVTSYKTSLRYTTNAQIYDTPLEFNLNVVAIILHHITWRIVQEYTRPICRRHLFWKSIASVCSQLSKKES